VVLRHGTALSGWLVETVVNSSCADDVCVFD
jgi:hypothetical protein